MVVTDSTAAPQLLDENIVQVWSNSWGTYAYGYKQQTICAISFPHTAIFTFTNNGDQITIYPDPHSSRERIDELYYQFVLQYALHVRGFEVLHSSAIETERGVVALCGISESGKSSLAFALSNKGYRAWADDAVIFRPTKDQMSVFSLPFRIKLRPDPADFFLQNNGSLNDESLKTISLKESIVKPLQALFILKRSEQEPVKLTALAPKQAFSAILPYAHSFDINDMVRKEEMINNYLELSSQTPIYELSFRTGLEHLFPTVDKIEQTIQSL